jgi:lipopolysaccharide export system protein LptA
MIRKPGAWALVAGLVLSQTIGLAPLPSLAQTAPAKPKRTPPPSEASEKAPSRSSSRPRGSDAPPIKPQEDAKNQPVTVDADRMESLKREGLIIFTGNVVARQHHSTQHADRMEVYLDEKGEKIIRSVSTGNVRIMTKDCRMGTARRAEYDDAEQRVVLIDNARVWQEDTVVTGERITMYLAEDRSVVQGGSQSRVKAVFYPKDEKNDARKREGGKPVPPECR